MLTTLRAHAEVRDPYDQFWYWAPYQTAIEVDLLLQRGKELLAVEVKAASRYHASLLKGLHAIEALPGLVRRVLVYTGRRHFRSSDGIDVWPAPRFAAATAAGSLWP